MARYMNDLRLSERTPRNQSDARRAYYGLMPPSISHEGYSDRPAYSYWDDFWTLAGYDGAITIAKALDRAQDGARAPRWWDGVLLRGAAAGRGNGVGGGHGPKRRGAAFRGRHAACMGCIR